MKHLKWRSFWIRLRHWEYWDSKFVYTPLYPIWLWYSLKAKSFYFLTAANPAIANGGFLMESKADVYSLLPKNTFPRFVYADPHEPLAAVLARIAILGLSFPLIGKPDYGERGLGVKKLNDPAELADYIRRMPLPYLIQEYVDLPEEVGIFYCRVPGEARGRITGIVGKEPITVIGDGRRTLAALIAAEPRYVLQWTPLALKFEHCLNEVLPQGKQIVLMPYGNHARGSRFTDLTRLKTADLEQWVDALCQQIPGFYYGRLDVRYRNWDSLCAGAEFSIIELNGSGSEPTHIYDPNHSLWFAWREIVRHWDLLFRVVCANRASGAGAYISLREGRALSKRFRELEQLLSAQSW